jgi:hypothetical protein
MAIIDINLSPEALILTGFAVAWCASMIGAGVRAMFMADTGGDLNV